MKNVICFTDSLGSGGAQRQLVGLACMLKENGYNVSVVMYHDKPFYKPQLDDAGIESIVVKATSYLGRIWALYKYFRKHPRATIIAYQEAPSLIACLLRPFIRCSKLIVSERNTTQVLTKKDKLRFLLYRYADYVVPNSFSQSNYIQSQYPRLASKVVCITNFVDTDYFRPIPRPDFSTTRTNTIIVIGSSKPQKNFHRFVDAVKIMVNNGINVSIDWYGIFPEYLEAFREYVSKIGLSDVFRVYGPTQNIVEVYHSADFFCLPSLFEGFPNVLCEAMSTGLPVACSNVCDNPYIISKTTGGILFNPLDVNDMSDKLKKMVSMTNKEWLQQAQTNRMVAEELFSPESFLCKYCKLL